MGVELYDLHQIKDNFIIVILTSSNVYLKYIHRVLNDRIGLTLIFRANTVATANTAFFMTTLATVITVMRGNCQVEEHGGDHRDLRLKLKIKRSGRVF